MVVEPAPATPLEVPQAQLLLEVLVIALDPPAQLGQLDQPHQGRVGRQAGQSVFGRFPFIRGPLHQQPQLGPGHGAIIVPMSGTDPQRGEA